MDFPLNYLQPYVYDANPRSDRGDLRFATKVEQYRGQELGQNTIALLGVPQHIGVERNGGRAGAAEAPAAIRRHLERLTISDGLNTISDRVHIVDCGDVNCDSLSLEQIHERQTTIVKCLLDSGAFVFVLGGGHDIAYANGSALLAHASKMSFINIDAHLDVRPLIKLGDEFVRHSGSPFRQLLEAASSRIPEGSSTAFGIQSFVAAASHCEYLREKGQSVRMLQQIRMQGLDAAFAEALIRASVTECIYCSFDIDAVGGAYAPGVSAVAVDGFSAAEVLSFMSMAASHTQVKLIDLVELNPRFDVDHRTARLVAQVLARGLFERARILADS